MQSLNQSVVAAGRVFAKGTARSDAEGVPDGPWWDGEAEAKSDGKTTKTRTSRQQADSDES